MRRLSAMLLLSTLILLGLMVLAPIVGAANPPEGTWQWGPPYSATVGAFHSLAAGPAGSVYVAGDAWSWQWTVSRISATDGSQIWTDSRSGPGDLGASAEMAASDSHRNLFVVGRAAARGGDIYLVKYSPTGAVIWQKSWDGPAHLADRPTAIAVTAAGDLYVTGTIGKAGGYDDAVLLKYSAAGSLKWKYIMTTALYDAFTGVARDTLGNAYVTGQRAGSMDSAQMVTLKIDASGHKIWQRTISGLGVTYNGQFVRVKGSSVYVAGALYKYRAWPVVAKYSLAGKTAWRLAASNSMSTLDDMTVDGKGRVVIVGSFEASPGADVITTAYMEVFAADGSGLTASAMFYSDFGPLNRYPARFNKVVVDSTGTIYCAGEWETSGTGVDGNAIVVRFPPIESPGWSGVDKIWRYDGPASGVDEFYALLRVSDAEICAAGMRMTGGGAQGVADRISLP